MILACFGGAAHHIIAHSSSHSGMVEGPMKSDPGFFRTLVLDNFRRMTTKQEAVLPLWHSYWKAYDIL